MIIIVIVIVIINYDNDKSDSSLRKSEKCDGFYFWLPCRKSAKQSWEAKANALGLQIVKTRKKNIQISLSYSKIVRSHFLRQRKSPFVHQMFPFLLKNALLWKSYGMNTVHVCSTWMLQTVDKDCWFMAFFVLTWYLTCCFFSPGCPSGATSYGKSNDGFNAFWGDVLFFYFFLTYRLLSVLYGNLFFIAV